METKYIDSRTIAARCNCHLRVVQNYLKENYSHVRTRIKGSYYYPEDLISKALEVLTAREDTGDYDLVLEEFKPKLKFNGVLYATIVELSRIRNRTPDSVRKLIADKFQNERIAVLSHSTRAYYYPYNLVKSYLEGLEGSKEHYVYVLADINSQIIKIGFSTNVASRILKLTHASGRELKKVYNSPPLTRTQALEMESKLHKHFAKWIAHHSKHVKWEWFEIDYQKVLEYIESM